MYVIYNFFQEIKFTVVCILNRCIDFFFRFSNFKENPLALFKIFDYSKWPRERQELARFGTDDLMSLTGLFPYAFSDEEKVLVQQEFF